MVQFYGDYLVAPVRVSVTSFGTPIARKIAARFDKIDCRFHVYCAVTPVNLHLILVQMTREGCA